MERWLAALAVEGASRSDRFDPFHRGRIKECPHCIDKLLGKGVAPLVDGQSTHRICLLASVRASGSRIPSATAVHADF